MRRTKGKLIVSALGGVHEIGKNMYMVQYGEDIVLIDCGSKFPNESLPGIDLIIPDVKYVLENVQKVRALLVTHGHEDHIGGIPYLLKQLNVPIYASRLTLGLIEVKLVEHKLVERTELNRIEPHSRLSLGAIQVEFFQTNHSIPDCLGIVLRTPAGTVVHTGDFKFDLSPANRQYPDLHRMAEIGKQGVTLLLSESTNAERPGFTPSERVVGAHILEAFQQATQQVFISTFASNVNRVQQIVDAAVHTNRKLVLLGRSMVNVVQVARQLGYLRVPDHLIIEPDETERYAPVQIAVLCTGSQGEPLAALARLASSTHRQLDILPGDTVILAANAIPGNTKNVSKVIDNLYMLGAKVIYGGDTGLHVSGHGCQEELKLMLSLMQPEYFIPVHGEYRMLYRHKLLAESVGVKPEHIFILDNGETVELQEGRAQLGDHIPSGNTLVDGLGIGDVGSIVLRDRKQLAADGILIMIVTLSKDEREVLSGPDIITRGFVYVRDSQELMRDIYALAGEAVQSLLGEKSLSWSMMKQTLKEKLGHYLYRETGRRPMIVPIIIEV
ncbi:ribonuclease J [Paenibacillus sp. SYP-B4298]|uniref:ribonuclease J n=1 Tax=Paenibacillus sp. SYP-B4298 TaxID=2996034 RepID=UPI0022DD9930|nr:ribonuclease J [Paenibacillus sp. SYP-B4298]